ncbi:MAG: hypothetical protein GYA17_18675 [Chloroflexi bacterium]|jgi:hypothetical protein|nr:hypothetical protein [Anaerolineaceae bacterium]NMB90390.1 hypothetical protein [Chloroflexota bacterium]
MAKLEKKMAFAGKSANDCYQAGLRIVEKAGYKILKRRDIAWLLVCEGNLNGNVTSLNYSVPLGGPSSVVLNFNSEQNDAAALEAEAERLFGLVGAELK